jgi:hypothetical protein
MSKKPAVRSAPPSAAQSSRPKSSAPVLKLTAKQSKLLADANCAVELLDSTGRKIGYLLHTPEITRFYTPAEFTHLLQRAANPRPGKPLKEILRDAEAKARAILEVRNAGRTRAGV